MSNYIEAITTEFKNRASKREVGHTVGWPVYSEREILAALDCMLDLRLSQGSVVKAFEAEYAEYLGVTTENGGGAIACNSGSSANLLVYSALKECGRLKEGDEVIVPAATFATVSSVLYQLGLTPVYVDSETNTWNLDPSEVEKAITDKTKAIMIVHNLGFPAMMDELLEIAGRHNLIVIEDCCEAHGAYYKGKQVGSFGDLASLSFFVAHNITTGEGGMVFYRDKTFNKILRQQREFGRMIDAPIRYDARGDLGEYDTRYIFESLGYNVRMTDILAAIGRVQLEKLDGLNRQRRENAERLTNILSKYGTFVETLTPMENCLPGYYGFPVCVAEGSELSRNEICKQLESKGIETRPNMGGCLPDQPGFIGQKHRVVGDLPVARLIRDRAFFIGVHSGLEPRHFEQFESALSDIFG